MELKMYRSETPSKLIEDDGAWAVLFADLEEWTLSTAANDAERERVCEQDCPCSVIYTT